MSIAKLIKHIVERRKAKMFGTKSQVLQEPSDTVFECCQIFCKDAFLDRGKALENIRDVLFNVEKHPLIFSFSQCMPMCIPNMWSSTGLTVALFSEQGCVWQILAMTQCDFFALLHLSYL